MTSSDQRPTSTTSSALQSMPDSSQVADTQKLLSQWQERRAQAPGRQLQAKRQRLLHALYGPTSNAPPSGSKA